MDLTNMTIDELQALMVLIQNRITQLVQQQADETTQTRVEITEAVATLDALIGDGTTTPNLDTIVGVQLFTDEQIGDNVVLAIRLLMQGLEVTARSLRDVAKVVGK